jgi:hypothetical protein
LLPLLPSVQDSVFRTFVPVLRKVEFGQLSLLILLKNQDFEKL